MRNTLFELIENDLRANTDSFLLTADTGYGLLEPLFKEFPDRVLNVGIAEQFMISMAAGLALEGGTVYCYAISNFLIHRALEMIRNDLCVSNIKVVLIGTSTGLENSILGPTHHVTDDIHILSSLHNLNIFSPYDPPSCRYAFQLAKNSANASYIRLCKVQKPLSSGRSAWEILHEAPQATCKRTILSSSIGPNFLLDSLELSENTILGLCQFSDIPCDLLDYVASLDALYVWEDSTSRQLYNLLASVLSLHSINTRLLSISPNSEYIHQPFQLKSYLQSFTVDGLHALHTLTE